MAGFGIHTYHSIPQNCRMNWQRLTATEIRDIILPFSPPPRRRHHYFLRFSLTAGMRCRLPTQEILRWDERRRLKLRRFTGFSSSFSFIIDTYQVRQQLSPPPLHAFHYQLRHDISNNIYYYYLEPRRHSNSFFLQESCRRHESRRTCQKMPRENNESSDRRE